MGYRFIPWAAASGGSGTLYAYSSDGDSNGVFAAIRAALGNVNPQGAAGGVVHITKPGLVLGSLSDLTDRATSNFAVDHAVNNYVAVDLGVSRTLDMTAYSLRNRSTAGFDLFNWKIQGSNNVASNDTTGCDAATWVTLDTVTTDNTLNTANEWYTRSVTPTGTGYRWLRLLKWNGDSAGDQYLCLGEWEFYGYATI